MKDTLIKMHTKNNNKNNTAVNNLRELNKKL